MSINSIEVHIHLNYNCSPCARATGQGNHFEVLPTVSMESQHSTGSPTCHDFPRFIIISEKSIPEVGNRWLWSSKNGGFLGKKTPSGQIFTNVFQRPTCAHRKTSFCANLVKFGRPEVAEIARYLMDKRKRKFRLKLTLPLLRGSRPKFVRDSSKQYIRSSPNFIQIRSLLAEL